MLIQRLRKFRKDEGGNFAIMFGLALTPLVMTTAVAIDYSNIERSKARLQETADSAALYAIREFRENGVEETDLKVFANDMLESNYDVDTEDTELDLDTDTNTLTVSIKTDYEPGMLAAFGYSKIEVKALTEVKYSWHVEYPRCLFLTDETSDEALTLNGSSDVLASGCQLYVNSSDDEAIDLDNAATITAGEVCIVGDVGDHEENITATVNKDCEQKTDEFANETLPTVGTDCDYTNLNVNNDTTINGGGNVVVFCGGINVMANKDLTLNDGIFVIKDGWMTMSGNSDLHGDDMVLYFTGNNVGFSMTGNSEAEISGRESGTLAGYSIYFDPNATFNAPTTFWGNGDKEFEGIMYFGDASVVIGGNGSINTDSPYSVLAAKNLILNGSAEFTYGIDSDESDLPVPDWLSGTKIIEAYISK